MLIIRTFSIPAISFNGIYKPSSYWWVWTLRNF